MGFEWKTTRNNYKLLKEKTDIVHKRIDYLRAIKKFRSEGRPIIYTDETYVHTSHVSNKSWSDSTNEGLHKPTSKGSRFIVVHAGGKTGFVPNALLVYKSHQTTGDYHNDMNFENYWKWLTEKLLPNLEPRSVIVIDNASYHNKCLNPAPTSASKKADMQEWLSSKGIYYGSDMLKVELYKLILLHKPKYKEYAIDSIIKEKGHNVLRLPPYHPDLNPIENIWAVLKGYVASNNVEMALTNVKSLIEEKVEKTDGIVWNSTCRRAEEAEKSYWENELAFDDITEYDQFIINTNRESDETESGDSDEE